MTGLDANVPIRYFAQDDPRQARSARQLIDGRLTRESPGYVAAIFPAQFARVLQRLYSARRGEIAAAIDGLLTAPALAIEHKRLAWKALHEFRSSNAGFSDCLIAHINAAGGCRTTYTFDRSAAKLDGFTLLA